MGIRKCMLTLSKSPFPSLPITASSLRCNTVTQPSIAHQQERRIPALWDSCFMLRITNWIVWGSIMYLNTKMQSYSLLFYEVSTLISKYAKCCVVQWKSRNEWWLLSICKTPCLGDSSVTGRHRKDRLTERLTTCLHLCWSKVDMYHVSKECRSFGKNVTCQLTLRKSSTCPYVCMWQKPLMPWVNIANK